MLNPACFSHLFHFLPRVKSPYYVKTNLYVVLVTDFLPWIYIYLAFIVHIKHNFYYFWHNLRTKMGNSHKIFQGTKDGIFSTFYSVSTIAETSVWQDNLHPLAPSQSHGQHLSTTCSLRAHAVSPLHDLWKHLFYAKQVSVQNLPKSNLVPARPFNREPRVELTKQVY